MPDGFDMCIIGSYENVAIVVLYPFDVDRIQYACRTIHLVNGNLGNKGLFQEHILNCPYKRDTLSHRSL